MGTFLPEEFKGLGKLSRDYVGFKTILLTLYFVYANPEVCTENKTLKTKKDSWIWLAPDLAKDCGRRHRRRNFMKMLAERQTVGGAFTVTVPYFTEPV